MNNSRTASEQAEAPIDPRSDPLFYHRGTAKSRAKAMSRYYDALIQANQNEKRACRGTCGCDGSLICQCLCHEQYPSPVKTN